MQNVRFAIRLLGRNPGFTAIVVLCLALGIGANSTVFSFVDGYWTRPLPVPDPGGLVRVFTTSERGPERVSYPEYLDLRDQTRSFSGLFVAERRGPILSGEGFTESTLSSVVSANYFRVLGIQAALGRVFTEGAGGTAAEPVVVMSHSLWQRRFGGDPPIAGKAIRLGGKPFTVLGVTPRGFRGTELWTDTDFWIPLDSWEAVSPGERAGNMNRKYRTYEVMGRLRPGVTVARAQAEIDGVARRLERAYPDTNKGRGAAVLSNFDYQVKGAGYAPLVLLGIVALVLLIACANVANLLLVRAEARRREIAVRLAMGSGRGQLLKQLVIESAVIAGLGAAAGLLLAAWLIYLLPFVVLPPDSYGSYQFLLDGRVVAFTLLVSLLTVLIFGLAPAIHSTRVDLVPTLKGEQVRAGRRLPAKEVLVVGQIALSLILLTAAGLLIRTFIRAMQADLGFQRKNLLIVELAPPYNPARARAFYDELLERLRAVPGVRESCVALRSPMAGHGGGMAQEVAIPGYEPPPTEAKLDVKFTVVGLNYFRVLGTRLLRGRDFSEHDSPQGRNVVIINESMARRFWPNEDPVGRIIRTGPIARAVEREIVGVVQDVRINSIEEAPEPYFYLPYAQSGGSAMTLMVETSSDPLLLIKQVKAEVAALDRSVAALDATSLSLLVRSRLHPQRVGATVVTALGAMGLLLALIGLYGVMSYSVTQRTREIGLRMALGAERRRIVGLILGRGIRLALAGCAIGLIGSLAASRTLAGFLYGISARDPLTFAVVIVLLLLVAAAAAYVPARRATRIDPMMALRYE